MKALLLTCYAGIFLMGCISTAHKDETLNPQAPADLVKIDKNHGSELPIAEIEVADRIEKLVSFVNSLPQKWSVPWYGPPVGKVYFNFYKDGRAVGNFYVGSNFFGRDVYYGHDNFNFFSQPATKEQIDGLGKIVGFDLSAYIHE